MSKGALAEGVFKGETINTPSMLAVEDVIFALDWAKSVGGLQGLMGRSDANAAALGKIVAERAKAKGITKVALDRGHCKYHGRVAAFADAARETGLDF